MFTVRLKAKNSHECLLSSHKCDRWGSGNVQFMNRETLLSLKWTYDHLVNDLPLCVFLDIEAWARMVGWL